MTFDPDIVYAREPVTLRPPTYEYDAATLQLRVDTLSHHVESLEKDRDALKEDLVRACLILDGLWHRVTMLESKC